MCFYFTDMDSYFSDKECEKRRKEVQKSLEKVHGTRNNRPQWNIENQVQLYNKYFIDALIPLAEKNMKNK